MKKHTSEVNSKAHRLNLSRISAPLLTLEAVLIEVCFVVAIFGIGLTVNRTNNLETKAAQPQTVSWSSIVYRHQICLAGTTQCQPFKMTTNTNANWTVASLVNYDLHVDVSTNGSDWYGWEHQTNKGVDCFGPTTCSYKFSWTHVQYKVSTTLDGNQEHTVEDPTLSYTYPDVGYGVSYTGIVRYRDFGNVGSLHDHQSLSGTTESQMWTLSAPTINGGDVFFNFSPAIGTGASLIIRNVSTNAVVKDSGALVSGSSTYLWSNAPAGTYKAVLFYYPKAISNEITIRVDRKAVMEKSESRCGTTGYPRNVIVRHQWKSAQGAFSAQSLQISSNSSFSANVQEKSISASTTSAEISGYESLKSYYVRVKSVTTDGKTIYSRTQGFSTIDCPSTAPTIPTATGVSGLPACVAVGAKYGDTLTFNWSAVSPVTSYTVRLTFDHATHGDYSTKTATTNSAGGTGGWNNGGNSNVTWVNNGNLAMSAGVTYYFAVQATNNGQNSGYDLVNKSFKVGPVSTCAATDADTDGDGFKDSVEDYVGTDKKIACGTSAWPPDFNDDKVVNSLDQMLLAKNLAAKGSPLYNKRYDLNKDTVINSGDQALLASKVGKSCNVLGINSGEVKAATIPTNMRVGKPVCSDTPTAVYIAWDGVGDYWVDYTWDNWQSSVHKQVKNAWVTSIPGGYTFGDGRDASWYVLFPGREYKWRIWNGSQHFPNADGQSFSVPVCSGGVASEYTEIHDYIFGLGSNKFMDLPVGDGNKVLARVELGRFLWGLAGCESGWNPSNNSNPTFKGLYQFLPSTWTGVLAAMGEPTNTSIFDGFAQTRAVIHNIDVSRSSDPWNTSTGRLYMFSTQWPVCSFIWNSANYVAGY